MQRAAALHASAAPHTCSHSMNRWYCTTSSSSSSSRPRTGASTAGMSMHAAAQRATCLHARPVAPRHSSWHQAASSSSSSSNSSSSSSIRRSSRAAAAAAPAAVSAGAPTSSAPASQQPQRAPPAAPPVMVNSCTGRMGHAAAEAVVAAGLTLVPFTLTGYSAGVAVANVGVRGVPVEVVGRERRQAAMDEVQAQHPGLIVIDYTTPACVNDNAEFYASRGLSFVMGTTGGDAARVAAAAQAAPGVYAVVSPQMGKQVVAFQATMAMLAAAFPGAFAGYTLDVVESHQRNKADTSGTAKAVVASFARLGALGASEGGITKVRERVAQLEVMGVPEESLDGHAFHTYTLTSPDGSVQFVFKHNVTGRSIYAEGTVDAVLFLAAMRAAGAPQRVYSMADVVRHGHLRGSG